MLSDYYYGVVSGFVTAFLLIITFIARNYLRFGRGDGTRRLLHISLTIPRSTCKTTPHPSTTTETLTWLNNILTRLVDDLNSSQFSGEIVRSRLEQLANFLLNGDFLEQVVIDSVSVNVPLQFKTISSSTRHVQVELEWNNQQLQSDLVGGSIQFASAIGYQGLIALPFEARVAVKSLKATLCLELHTHYFRIRLADDFHLSLDLSTSLGHRNKIVDSPALHDYIKGAIERVIRRGLIDNGGAVVPYASVMTCIPRVLSPPMSPIPADQLFAGSVDELGIPGSYN
jgi:hypothetical protein